MKNLFVLLSVVGLSFAALDVPDHLKAPMKLMRKACVAESGVDEKYIDASRGGNLPNVPELGCYILCIFEHAGMIEDDGTIHWSQVLHLLSPGLRESAEKVVKACSTIHGSTRCETAWLTTQCYFQTEPEGAELP